MALNKTIETASGIVVNNAYLRVEEATVKNKNQLYFFVKYFASVEKPEFESKLFFCPYELDGANPIAQAYVHLKTLPEFSGANDC